GHRDDLGRERVVQRDGQHVLECGDQSVGPFCAVDVEHFRSGTLGASSAPTSAWNDRQVTPVHPSRHLLRAKDLIDARYADALDVPALARAARLSPAHFSREFRRAFGVTPHQYLLTRRLERAAELLRLTDRSVADVCFTVGLKSVGSF